MDAVLEPFPADRLFPGSSFLDLGDLNESDFLNNAVRRRVCAPLPPLRTPLRRSPAPRHPPPRQTGLHITGQSGGGGWRQGPPEGHVRGALRSGDEVPQHLPSARAWAGASELAPGRAPPGGSVWEDICLHLLGKGTSRRRRRHRILLRCGLERHKSCPRPGFQDQIARKVDPRLVLRWEAHRGAFEGPETRRPGIQTRTLRGAAAPKSGTRCPQEGT